MADVGEVVAKATASVERGCESSGVDGFLDATRKLVIFLVKEGDVLEAEAMVCFMDVLSDGRGISVTIRNLGLECSVERSVSPM